MKYFANVIVLLLSIMATSATAERYMTQDEFLQLAFPQGNYQKQTLWLNKDIKAIAKQILKHDYRGLRIRYWGNSNSTAWILDEIGKEHPITIGVIVDNHQAKPVINDVKILEFRESRGWEVRYPFFTAQFEGVHLASDQQLNKTIDGISGATLSVRAVKKVAALALYLHGISKNSPSES